LRELRREALRRGMGSRPQIAVNDDDRIDQFAEEMVEAPPGFEPGVEVLQLDLSFQLPSKSTGFLSESARLVFLSSAEECPLVPRWL
jgi:hypothetical protein